MIFHETVSVLPTGAGWRNVASSWVWIAATTGGQGERGATRQVAEVEEQAGVNDGGRTALALHVAWVKVLH